jgi:hypothetical protein
MGPTTIASSSFPGSNLRSLFVSFRGVKGFDKTRLAAPFVDGKLPSGVINSNGSPFNFARKVRDILTPLVLIDAASRITASGLFSLNIFRAVCIVHARITSKPFFSRTGAYEGAFNRWLSINKIFATISLEE